MDQAKVLDPTAIIGSLLSIEDAKRVSETLAQARRYGTQEQIQAVETVYACFVRSLHATIRGAR